MTTPKTKGSYKLPKSTKPKYVPFNENREERLLRRPLLNPEIRNSILRTRR